MNILFLYINEIKDSNSGYIYADLIRTFSEHGHKVYAVTPTCNGTTKCYIDSNNVNILSIKNGQIQKTNKIKKAINLLMLEKHTIKAIKKYAKGVKFDLIINMCSSLCYTKVMAYFKKRDKAISYLLLKDIFPQNAVDIGMLKTSGLMGIVYRHFRKKERKLYSISNHIGCMSQANADYIVEHNPEIDKSRVTIVPNSIDPIDVSLSDDERGAMRDKYIIPQDKIVFVYGGNLGRPQGIPFIIRCLRSQKDNSNVFFLLVGDGTEYSVLEHYVDTEKPTNVKLMKRLPREDFDRMVAACDVGLIFLDYRFTVPNYPSRLLSYMQAGLAVLACTDTNTDVGKDIESGGFGIWCESSDTSGFARAVETLTNADLQAMGENAKTSLVERYSVSKSYEQIMSAVQP